MTNNQDNQENSLHLTGNVNKSSDSVASHEDATVEGEMDLETIIAKIVNREIYTWDAQKRIKSLFTTARREEGCDEKFYSINNGILINFIKNKFFKKEYSEGWLIDELIRDGNGDWIVRWKRDYLLPIIPSKPYDVLSKP